MEQLKQFGKIQVTSKAQNKLCSNFFTYCKRHIFCGFQVFVSKMRFLDSINVPKFGTEDKFGKTEIGFVTFSAEWPSFNVA